MHIDVKKVASFSKKVFAFIPKEIRHKVRLLCLICIEGFLNAPDQIIEHNINRSGWYNENNNGNYFHPNIK